MHVFLSLFCLLMERTSVFAGGIGTGDHIQHCEHFYTGEPRAYPPLWRLDAKYLQPDTWDTVQWDSQHDELMGERGTRECFHENTFTKQWKMSEAANVYINSSGQWGQEADQGTQD